MKLQTLVGSGDRIMVATVPSLVVGLILNVAFPSFFSVGGPPSWLGTVSVVVSLVGATLWIWAVVLVLTRVSRDELITTGPFALMKHPIYTSVALLVLPWTGFLLNTWLGAAVGIVMYLEARRFTPDEEAELSETFGVRWEEYRRSVVLPWL